MFPLPQTALAVALAASQPSAAPVNFNADLFLVGNWQCTLDRPGLPRRIEQAHYDLDLRGSWLGLRYRVFEGGKLISETQAYETYDPKLGKWVYSSFGSQGNYGTSYSDGWLGSRKVYRPATGAANQFVLTATRLNERQFTEQVDVPVGTAMKTVSFLNCTKQ